MTRDYEAKIAARDLLDHRAKTEVCTAESHELMVAYVSGEWTLRCKCSINPETKTRNQRSLRRIYEEDGIAALGSLDRQTLAHQLHNKVRSLEADGQYNTTTHFLVARLEDEMTNGKSMVPVSETRAVMTSLTAQHIKAFFCPKATDMEAKAFIQFCIHQDLNPFLKEAFLVKYQESEPASMIVAKDGKLKRANKIPAFEWHKAGIIIMVGDELLKVPGAFLPPKAQLLGGWAHLKRKDRSEPYIIEVGINECIQTTRDGNPNRFWKSMPATMCRKVALSRVLSEAFPDAFEGLYEADEVGIDYAELDTTPILYDPGTGEIIEGTPHAVPPDDQTSDSAPTNEVAEQEEVENTATSDPEAPMESQTADFRAAMDAATSIPELDSTAAYIAGAELPAKDRTELRTVYSQNKKRIEQAQGTLV